VDIAANRVLLFTSGLDHMIIYSIMYEASASNAMKENCGGACKKRWLMTGG
jgi:hypothetical protein